MANRFWVGGTGSWNTTNTANWSASSGGAGGASVPTAADNAFFDALSGGGVVTAASAANTCLNLDFTGFTGTFAGASALTVAGSRTWGAAMTLTYSGTITFTATTPQTLTQNGVVGSGNHSATFNGVGGSWTATDAARFGGTVTLTNGTLDFTAAGATIGKFVSSNTNVRKFSITGQILHVTGNSTPWDTTTSTNLTLNAAGSLISFENSTATNATMQSGGLTYNDVAFAATGAGNSILAGNSTFRDLLVSATGGGSFQCSATINVRNVDFTGFVGTWTGGGQWSFSGNLTLSPAMSVTSTTNLFFVGTGAQSIKSNGKTLGSVVRQNGIGGTTTLLDALVTTGQIQIENGTFDTGSFAVTCSALQLSEPGFGTRAFLAHASPTVTLTGTGTVLTTNGSVVGLTFDAGTSTFVVTSVGATLIVGAGLSLYNLTLNGGGGGSFTFNDAIAVTNALKVLSGPYTVVFPSTKTVSLGLAAFSATGSAGNLVALQASTPGVQATISSPGNDCISQYCSVKDIAVTGGARWFAGRLSTDLGNNNGWRFTDLYRRPQRDDAAPYSLPDADFDWELELPAGPP